jgi:hypothetical protein
LIVCPFSIIIIFTAAAAAGGGGEKKKRNVHVRKKKVEKVLLYAYIYLHGQQEPHAAREIAVNDDI